MVQEARRRWSEAWPRAPTLAARAACGGENGRLLEGKPLSCPIESLDRRAADWDWTPPLSGHASAQVAAGPPSTSNATRPLRRKVRSRLRYQWSGSTGRDLVISEWSGGHSSIGWGHGHTCWETNGMAGRADRRRSSAGSSRGVAASDGRGRNLGRWAMASGFGRAFVVGLTALVAFGEAPPRAL